MKLVFLIGTLLSIAEAAPVIITRTFTADPVTVAATLKTVYTTKTNIQTVNGPPNVAATTSTTPEVPTTTTTSTTPDVPTPSTTTTPDVPTSTTTTTSTIPSTSSTSSTLTTSTLPIASTTSTTSSSTTSTSTTSTSTTSTSTTSTSTTSTSTTSTSPSPSPTLGSSLTPFEAQILQTHNDKRALHGVQDLKWNPVLAQYAADYAARTFSCDNVQLVHSGGPYGENLAAGYVGGVDPVIAWYDEIQYYDYNTPGFSEQTGHFTQVVWKSTSEVGCAEVLCNNIWRQYTICEYSNQRGNIVGTNPATGHSFFADNVLPLV